MNPFNPTFGDVPKILIDNDPKTTDIYKKYHPITNVNHVYNRMITI